MSFKKHSLFAVCALGLFIIYSLILGCAQENVPYTQPTIISLGEDGCIDGFSQTIDNYVHGRSHQAEVSAFWNCLSKTVNQFNNHVKGAESHHYHQQELKTFIEDYLIKDKKMTQGLFTEVMRIKTLLVGGSIDYVTRGEIQLALKTIVDLERITQNLLPYITKILNQPYIEDTANHGIQPIDKAVDVLYQSFTEIGDIIAKNNVDYKFSSLTNLITELENYDFEVNKDGSLGTIKAYVAPVAKLKSLFLGTTEDAVLTSDWKDLLGIAARIYSIFVRYDYLGNHDFKNGEGLDQLNKGIRQIGSLLNFGLSNQKSKTFSHDKLEDIFEAFGGTNLLSDSFTPQVLTKTWKVLVDKVLSVGNAPVGGLNSFHVDNLMSEYNFWFDAQSEINKVFSSPIKKASCSNPLFIKSLGLIGLEEMKMVTDCAPWAANLTDEPRLNLNYSMLDNKHNHYSVSTMNWQRAVVRLIMVTYSEDKTRRIKRSGIKETELKNAYIDLKPLLVALDFVAKDDETFYKEIFRDTKLFMPQSDGGDHIEFAEGVEYFYGVVAGSTTANKMVEDMIQSCPYKEKIDEKFGAPFIDVDCFDKKVAKDFAKYYYHLPDFVKYQATLNQKEWAAVVNNIKVSIGYTDEELPYMSQYRITRFSVLLQMVETYMMRFDKDRDNDLSPLEIAGALPLIASAASTDPQSGPLQPQGFLDMDRGGLIATIATLGQILPE